MSSHTYAVIDFETTGLSNKDRALEIGVVLVDSDFEVEREWETVMQPERDIDNAHIHRLDATLLVNAPTFSQVAAELCALLDGRVLVAHNAPFDMRFLRNELERLGVTLTDPEEWSLCTQRLSQRVLPGSPRSLADCLAVVGIDNEDAHTALADARATALLIAELARRAPAAFMGLNPLRFTDEQREQLDGLTRRAALTRVEAQESVQEASNGKWISTLAQRIPPYGDAELEPYRQALAVALVDQKLSPAEVSQLLEIAASQGISKGEALEIHEEFLKHMAVQAWSDGIITEAERESLLSVARQLGVDSFVVENLLQQPVDGDFSLFSLEPGQRISFTGALELGRSEWGERARESGLEVTAVTKKTALLVAANPDSMSGKARKARTYNIPIVDEVSFARLLHAMNNTVDEAIDDDETNTNELSQSGNQPEMHVVEQSTQPDTTALTLFPWLKDLTAKHIAMPSGGVLSSETVAKAWREHYSAAPLANLSPILNSDFVHELGLGGTLLDTWKKAYPEELSASINDLLTLRGFGRARVWKVLLGLVEEAWDAYETAAIDVDEALIAADIPVQVPALEMAPQEQEEIEEIAEPEPEVEPELEQPVEHEQVAVQNRPALSAHDGLVAWWGRHQDNIPAYVRALAEEPVAGYSDAELNQAIAQAAFAELHQCLDKDPRYDLIFVGREVLGRTLDEIGTELGVTRERVRQLHKVVAGDIENTRYLPQIKTLVTEEIGGALPLTQFYERVPFMAIVDARLGLNLLEICLGKRELESNDGWLINAGFKDTVERALEAQANDYGVVDVMEILPAIGYRHGLDLLKKYLKTTIPTLLWLDDNLVAINTKSYPDRACALLYFGGEPLSSDELITRMGSGNARSMSNQMSLDPRLTRCGRDRWALTEWNLPEYSSITEWIKYRISQGPVTIQNIIDEDSTRLDISETSIRAYAAGAEFVVENGYLRLATAEDLQEQETRMTPEITKHLYKVGSAWLFLVTVNHDHLRGSGSGLPRGVQQALEIPPLSKRTFTSADGEVTISSTAILISIGSVKRFLDAQNIQEGERVFYIFDGTDFDLIRATDLDPSLTGIAAILNQLGVDTLLPDTDVPFEEKAHQLLNEVLMLPANAPRRKVVRRLRDRKQDEIADELTAL